MSLCVDTCHCCTSLFAVGDDYTRIIADQEVGTSPFTFSVQILEDNIDEDSEMFSLVLSAISSDVLIDTDSSTATVTIVDDDSKPSII